MADELDLEKGDPERADKLLSEKSSSKTTPLKNQRRRVSNSGATRRKSNSDSATEELLTARLVSAFEHLAEWRESKDDQELADALREDARAMTNGLVSLTRSVRFLRSPLLFLLALIEPVLAFGKVGRILGRRWYAWQTSRQAHPQPDTEKVTVWAEPQSPNPEATPTPADGTFVN